MKINTLPGEFGFRALIYNSFLKSWQLSETYYFTEDEVKQYVMHFEPTDGKYKWPVEVWENGSIYISDQEEWK